MKFSLFPSVKPPESVNTHSIEYGFLQQKAKLVKVVLPDTKCSEASCWKAIDYQITITWCSRLHLVGAGNAKD